MFQNYLKIALRHLIRNKSYSIINIFGLAIGIACCLLILMFVKDELSYDNYHHDGEQIYRMGLVRKYPGRERKYAIIPAGYSEIMSKEFPEVESTCRLAKFGGSTTFKKGEESFEERDQMWADSNFFEMFSIPLLKGDIKTALSKPNAVVLTESMAKRYFGDENPVGKIMDVAQDPNDMTVTGVCADVPENTHFNFEFLISSATLNFWKQPNYLSFSAYTYIKLSPNASAANLEAKFDDMVTKYASGPVLTNFGVNYDEYQKQGNGYEYSLTALSNIYLDSNLEAELKPPGSRTRVYFFLAIAIMILLIACINFMNLATARSAERAREVGIRKTLGSDRKDIAWQFLIEAVAISLISTVVAWGLLHYFIPAFNQLADKHFVITDIVNWQYIPWLLGLSIVVGLISGLYPAAMLSGFNPLEVLRGSFSSTHQGKWMRNGLVGFQFFVSIALIIATIIIYQQLDYLQNKQLGFDKEHVITLQNAQGMTVQQEETFKKEIGNLTGVSAVSGCNTSPGGYYFGLSMKPPKANEMTTGSGMMVDEGYVECMGMNMAAGRSFSDDFMDTLSVVINQSAAKELGLTEPIGAKLVSNDDLLNPNKEVPSVYTVVGVVEDFHFQSLHQTISPLFFIHNQRNFTQGVDPLITVRLKPQNIQNTIAQIETKWKIFQPEQPFNYTFLDKDWSALYIKEEVQKNVFWRFSLLAIFIACMGLLGLAAYITQQRTKEIGIRKVLGASIPNIVALLSLDFMKLVGIAFLIAAPMGWYFGNQWLQDFAYSIEIEWWMFALAGILAVLIAFLTVSFQSIKAAMANPIHALKDE